MPASQENRSDAPSTDSETRSAQPLKPSEVLDRAAVIVGQPGAWTQGEYARREPMGQKLPATSPDAGCHCTIGALWTVAAQGNEAAYYRGLAWFEDASPEVCFLAKIVGTPNIIGWNDEPDRTQAEVVQALRQAAELARKEGQ